VVNINTESTIKNPHARRRGNPRAEPDPDQDNGGDDSPFQDFFDKFFGGQNGPEAGTIRQRSLGSGVIVDSKGYIVTNRHVVEKADRIRVKLQDENPRPGHDARLIGMDRAFVSGFLLVLSPWLVRNYEVFGRLSSCATILAFSSA